MKNVVLDIETSITFAEALEICGEKNQILKTIAFYDWIAVTKQGESVRQWHKSQISELVDYLESCDTITGWNIDEFDIKIIEQTYRDCINAIEALSERQKGILITQTFDFKTQDIFKLASESTKTSDRKYGMAYKLSEICTANGLGEKLEDSAKIPEIFKAGDLKTVFAHCTQDVMLEEQVAKLALEGRLMLPTKADKYGTIEAQTLIMPDTTLVF